MLVHRAVVIGAAIALNVFAVGVLGTSAALATGETTAPVSVTAAAPGEMGYNGVSPDEMGYN